MKKPKDFPKKLFLNVLMYKEAGKWVAHCLEMDLKGFGKTKNLAFLGLKDLVEMQISFAYFKNDPNLIWHPADPHYFQIFGQIREEKIKSFMKEEFPGYEISNIPFPQPIKSKKYELAHA